jgi:hypothetical protein
LPCRGRTLVDVFGGASDATIFRWPLLRRASSCVRHWRTMASISSFGMALNFFSS